MAGELITTDYQVELNAVLMGVGTRWELGEEGIDGLGVPAAKSADVDLIAADGAYGAPDYMGVRTLLVHLVMTQDDDGHNAWDQLALLAPAWEPSLVDVELHLQLPAFGHIFFTGRPRSLEADAKLGPKGRIDAIGEFRALNPRAQAYIP